MRVVSVSPTWPVDSGMVRACSTVARMSRTARSTSKRA
ncbi:hypothetical protein PPH41_05050 [Burkholderia gladioli]|nr:hypothetical protein [Burkholderia gladioli]